MSGDGRFRQAGVSLIELAVILVVIGLMVVVAVALVPRLTERMRLDTTSDVTIDAVRRALVSFAANHSRLPCADTNGNGLEGGGVASSCATAPADTVGLVPYRALGFSDPILDEAHLPVRYAVYRNSNGGTSMDSSLNADLAALGNRFIPVLPGHSATVDFPVDSGGNLTNDNLSSDPPLVYPSPLNLVSEGLNPEPKMPDNQNDLDFCLALRNARAAAPSDSHVRTLDLGGATPSFNAAFVLASGGVEDADGDGADLAFDGANAVADLEFESPARRRNDIAVAGLAYDDIIYAMPFDRLESRMTCASATIGVNAAANVALAAAHMVVQTEDVLWLAERNTEMDDLAVTLAELSVALSVINTVMSITDGITAGFNAACPPTATDAAAIGPIVAAGIANAVGVGLAAYALVVANQQGALNDAVLEQALADALDTNDMAARFCVDAVNLDARGGQGDAPPTQPSPDPRP